MRKPLTMGDFPIPETFELETKMLSTMLFDSSTIPTITRIVREDMISDENNLKVYQAIMKMFNSGEVINFSTVLPKVDRKHFIDHIIGISPSEGIGELDSLIAAFIDTYIKRKAYLASVEALQKITRGESSVNITSLFEGFSKAISEGLKPTEQKNSMQIADDLATIISKGDTNTIPTSIRAVDFLTYGGLQGGSLVILAARPSVGKTTIALQMALNASKVGKKTLIFSLEMTREQLVRRMILSTGYVTPMEIYSKNINWDSYDRAVYEVTNENLLINDRVYGIDEICQKIRLASQSDGVKFIVIDYLGLIPVANSRQNLAVALGEMTRKLKICAKECDVPILLLCQLSRSSASENRSPQLHDLRDSGSIEQDADVVFMLERMHDENMAVVPNQIALWVRKNRDGKCTFDEPIKLQGNETYSSFQEI